MTNKEMVVNILQEHACLTSTEIKNFIKRTYNITLSPQTVSATLRPLLNNAEARKAPNANGKMVYWLTKPEWKV